MLVQKERMLRVSDSIQSVGFPNIEDIESDWNIELND